MILSGRSSKALKTFRQVAAFNGKKEEGEALTLEVETQRIVAWGTNLGSALGLSPPLASVSPAHKLHLMP